jgi:hypothetical protein
VRKPPTIFHILSSILVETVTPIGKVVYDNEDNKFVSADNGEDKL